MYVPRILCWKHLTKPLWKFLSVTLCSSSLLEPHKEHCHLAEMSCFGFTKHYFTLNYSPTWFLFCFFYCIFFSPWRSLEKLSGGNAWVWESFSVFKFSLFGVTWKFIHCTGVLMSMMWVGAILTSASDSRVKLFICFSLKRQVTQGNPISFYSSTSILLGNYYFLLLETHSKLVSVFWLLY